MSARKRPSSLKGNSDESVRQRLFDPCNKKVELWMGYPGKLQFMMKGIFTTLSPSFPSSGGPTLTVGALNLLHRFRGDKHTQVFENQTPSDIAKTFTLSNPATQTNLKVVPDSDNDKPRKTTSPLSISCRTTKQTSISYWPWRGVTATCSCSRKKSKTFRDK